MRSLAVVPRACRWVAVLTLAIAAAGCSDGGGSAACAGKSGVAGTREVAISSGGLERSFLLTAPESALGGDPVPLVLVFHGVLADGEVIQAVTGFPEKAAAEGFVTAAGDGVGRSWNAGVCCAPASDEGIDDVGFTRDVVAAIESEYCIDPDRVYATGFSRTGPRWCSAWPARRRTSSPRSPPWAARWPSSRCEPTAPRPIQIVNNVSDPVVPFALGEFSYGELLELNACDAAREVEDLAPTATCEIAPQCAGGATTELCAVEDVGHMWPGGATNPDGRFDATDAVWNFLSSYSGAG